MRRELKIGSFVLDEQKGNRQKKNVRTLISGFRRDVEICALLGYYAAFCGNCLQTFRDNGPIRYNVPVLQRHVCIILAPRLWLQNVAETCKGKGKVLPRRSHEGPEGEYRYRSTTIYQMRVGGQLNAPAALPPGKRPGTHCIAGWVDPRAGLDGCGKSHPHLDSIPGPSSPQRVTIPAHRRNMQQQKVLCAVVGNKTHMYIQLHSPGEV